VYDGIIYDDFFDERWDEFTTNVINGKIKGKDSMSSRRKINAT